MKKVLIILNLIGIFACSNAQVGINTSTPSTHAALDVNSQISTNVYGGLMPPKLTLAQRDAMTLTAADDGLMAYVSGFSNGDRCLQLFNGSTLAWESIKCFALAITTPGILFSETVGTPSTTTFISVYETANGFDNDGVTFSSSSSPEADVRTSTVSDTPGASGSGNIFMGTLTSNTRNFLISGINVTAYSGPLTLKLLIHKAQNATNGSDLTIEYSTNGITWTNVSVIDLPVAASGTTGWYERVLSTAVPNTIQQIRFSKTAAYDFRIDDIKIIKP